MPDKPEVYHFFVNKKKYESANSSVKGSDIKTMAEVPPDYQLFLEGHGHDPDRPIGDNESVDLTNPPKHFFSVPPATFGRS